MGLMICQSIIDSSNGTIKAHSNGEGQGACFTFTMPMKHERLSLTPKKRNLTENISPHPNQMSELRKEWTSLINRTTLNENSMQEETAGLLIRQTQIQERPE